MDAIASHQTPAIAYTPQNAVMDAWKHAKNKPHSTHERGDNLSVFGGDGAATSLNLFPDLRDLSLSNFNGNYSHISPYLLSSSSTLPMSAFHAGDTLYRTETTSGSAGPLKSNPSQPPVTASEGMHAIMDYELGFGQCLSPSVAGAAEFNQEIAPGMVSTVCELCSGSQAIPKLF